MKHEIPYQIMLMVNEGRWPVTNDDMEYQEANNIFDVNRVRNISRRENRIVFFNYPFVTMEWELKNNKAWDSGVQITNNLDCKNLLTIAYFGYGSDSLIVLDYSNSEIPKVLYLDYDLPRISQNILACKWTMISESFEQFADLIGLDCTKTCLTNR